MKNALLATLLFVGTIELTACGTLTGIPSHGGGKRFAVEQELVAASARAAAKEMDLSALQGRKVALYISTMGDQGSGNISGGRYSIDALIRGEYLNTPSGITIILTLVTQPLPIQTQVQSIAPPFHNLF